jgi:hypothetical protein
MQQLPGSGVGKKTVGIRGGAGLICDKIFPGIAF